MNTGGEAINANNWFKQTKTADGVKTTTLFQRSNKPRDLSQKFVDFFSGIKKAKDSTTLAEAFKSINSKSSIIGKFNVNLIPEAINKMAPEAPKDLLDKGKPSTEITGNGYKLSLDI